jgi:hypothetical protein
MFETTFLLIDKGICIIQEGNEIQGMKQEAKIYIYIYIYIYINEEHQKQTAQLLTLLHRDQKI